MKKRKKKKKKKRGRIKMRRRGRRRSNCIYEMNLNWFQSKESGAGGNRNAMGEQGERHAGCVRGRIEFAAGKVTMKSGLDPW